METFTVEQMRNVLVNSFLLGGALGFGVCYLWLVRGWQKKAFKGLDVAEKWKQAYEDLAQKDGRP